jgi:hypothetical protein
MATTGTIHLDTVEGSQLTVTGTAARMYRGFTIEGIDATALPDASVMLVARDLALSSGGSTYPGAPNYNLTDVIIRGISSDAVQGQLVYETFAGLEPSVYIVRDASFSQERRVCFSPVDGTLFSVDFKNTDGDVVIEEDVAHVVLDWPMRAISVTATRFGRPPAGLGRSVPSVNDLPWPLEDPYPKGFWTLWNSRASLACPTRSAYHARMGSSVSARSPRSISRPCCRFSRRTSRRAEPFHP